MAVISPFFALLPSPSFAVDMVFTGALKPLLKNQGGVSELQKLLQSGAFKQDVVPAFYIYQVEEQGQTQTGFWTQIIPGDIKLHEHILAEKILPIRQFRAATGIESKPVLLTYRPLPAIKVIIGNIMLNPPTVNYFYAGQTHRLWRIVNTGLIETFKYEFSKIGKLYMADGHHRLAAHPFKTLSALLMDSDEIRVKPYHRIVGTEKTLQAIAENFTVTEVNEPVMPQSKGHLGLFKDGKWYSLIVKASKPYDTETIAALFDDIEYTPEVTGIPGKLLFTLPPLSINEVLAVADAGEILPPKSTWIEPKVPFGLLLHKQLVG